MKFGVLIMAGQIKLPLGHQHPIWAPVQAPDALLLIQLATNAPKKKNWWPQCIEYPCGRPK